MLCGWIEAVNNEEEAERLCGKEMAIGHRPLAAVLPVNALGHSMPGVIIVEDRQGLGDEHHSHTRMTVSAQQPVQIL